MDAIEVLGDPVVMGKILLASIGVSAACVLAFPPLFQGLVLARNFFRRNANAIMYVFLGLFVLRLVA